MVDHHCLKDVEILIGTRKQDDVIDGVEKYCLATATNDYKLVLGVAASCPYISVKLMLCP